MVTVEIVSFYFGVNLESRLLSDLYAELKVAYMEVHAIQYENQQCRLFGSSNAFIKHFLFHQNVQQLNNNRR